LVPQSVSDRIAEELRGEDLLIRSNGNNGAGPSSNGAAAPLNGSNGVAVNGNGAYLNGNGAYLNGNGSSNGATNGAGPKVIPAGCASKACRQCT